MVYTNRHNISVVPEKNTTSEYVPRSQAQEVWAKRVILSEATRLLGGNTKPWENTIQVQVRGTSTLYSAVGTWRECRGTDGRRIFYIKLVLLLSAVMNAPMQSKTWMARGSVRYSTSDRSSFVRKSLGASGKKQVHPRTAGTAVSSLETLLALAGRIQPKPKLRQLRRPATAAIHNGREIKSQRYCAISK